MFERQNFYVEAHNLLYPFQSGFRKGRSTIDPIIKLESDIRKAQVCCCCLFRYGEGILCALEGWDIIKVW